MLFEYTKLKKEDFKEFLQSKNFNTIDIPIVGDHAAQKKEYTISVQSSIDNLIDLVFHPLKKDDTYNIYNHFNYLDSLIETETPFKERNQNTTLFFIFKSDTVSILIKDFFHISLNETDDIDFSLMSVCFDFKKSSSLEQFLLILVQKTKEYFKNTYNLDYTVDNLAHIRTIIHTKYNLNAPHYKSSINKKYNQGIMAQYMDKNYDKVMISSIINRAKTLSSMVKKPVVDLSIKAQHPNNSYGNERLLFPVAFIRHIEPLLNHIFLNDWSKKTIQLINALILYQSAINGLTINHFSIIMPSLEINKKSLENFELFKIVSESEFFFYNEQNFKIIFGLNIKIQVKNGPNIIYDHDFENLDQAYIHFIDYFSTVIINRIPSTTIINNDTFKILKMMNI